MSLLPNKTPVLQDQLKMKLSSLRTGKWRDTLEQGDVGK